MKPWCACYQCRPPEMSFKEALRLANKLGQVKSLGVEEYERREREKAERLEWLKNRRTG